MEASAGSAPPTRPLPAGARDGERERMLRDVMRGLGRRQKELLPRYFYDTRGSELFEAITRLPEYYLTRAERALLERHAPPWIGRLRPRALVELGPGGAGKSRLLLDQLPAGAVYVPVDVSAHFLERTAAELRGEYPELTVEPLAGDFTGPLRLPRLPGPVLHAFLGSTLGNLRPAAAGRLLRRIARRMTAADRFLLGVDLRPSLRKPLERVERAYDDAAGVTAEFNLNVLRVLNRQLGADFDPGAFRHLAFYDARHARIEMHLVSLRPQTVTVPGGGVVRLEAGERIRTEISCKYDRAAVEALMQSAGLSLAEWVEDEPGDYALALGALP